ncbi:cache domain-containing sensor histidine kinase [Clostridium sp.]|uniref:cache domain-containing sensor histidine kinase n=1 Tax=Clostridium sp. TaxID=1506 RepID=UPI002FC6FC2E
MSIKKSMIYKRLFIIYILVIVFLIGALDVFFIKRVTTSNKENKSYINEKVAYDVNDELNKINNSNKLIVESMYNNSYIVYDVIDFLNMDKVSYLKKKLDRFSDGNDYFYNGIENFTRSSFSSNLSLEDITFISYSRAEESSFNRLNQISVKKLNNLNIIRERNFTNVVCEKNRISFLTEIRNPSNLKGEGVMVLTYNLDKIKDVIKKYENGHEVMVLDEDGFIVYDSNGDYEYKYYEYFPKILKDRGEVKLEKDYYVNRISGIANLTTIAKIPEKDLNKVPDGFYNSIIFVDILLLVISQAIVLIKLRKFSDRTDNILVAMEKVKNGDFNVNIPVTGENDEINYISENFNDMCTELNKYIEKSYLAEIDQKKAEMIALQNQINPHFLYNTLESIRMKAICNGDKDVGKMLYHLAFLFRKQVKDNNVITIRNELEYCTKYIEIFKFRYEDKFTFEVNCDDELLDKQILKFTMQPLIENYFVHGIRLDREDNLLKLNIKKEDDNIVITIEDNGNGITEEKMYDLNYKLKNRLYDGASIGVTNANERIVIAYGEDYGIKVETSEMKGAMVVVKLPCKEV